MIQGGISLILFGAVFWFVFRMLGKNGKNQDMGVKIVNSSDGKSKPEFNFGHVAGNDEAKDSVADIVDFIRTPEKYSKYGAKMPRGVLFHGPPGTGKTLMAKAIAGEAGVPFYAVAGSDFVQMYVGVGAGRIRGLFKAAREHGKAVIFIDEIDALGKKRGSAAASGNDERDQTLNALLTEMSGFSNAEGIVVIAATNRLDTLDEALLRPGRFDRQVEIGLPDLSGRESILKLHAGNKPLSEEIRIDELARQTVYFSGAMLENLLNEAAISAAKRDCGTIRRGDVEAAYYTVIAGSEKKNRGGILERDRQVAAYHEAGHALCSKLTVPEGSVPKITVIPSTKGAGGFCVNIPPERMFNTKAELEAQVMVSLAGRAAEELVFGAENVTTGASNDLQRASAIIRDYILKYGMGGEGFSHADFGGNGERLLDEYSAHFDRLYRKVRRIINDNMDKLKNLAEKLLEKETLNEVEVDEIMNLA